MGFPLVVLGGTVVVLGLVATGGAAATCYNLEFAIDLEGGGKKNNGETQISPNSLDTPAYYGGRFANPREPRNRPILSEKSPKRFFYCIGVSLECLIRKKMGYFLVFCCILINRGKCPMSQKCQIFLKKALEMPVWRRGIPFSRACSSRCTPSHPAGAPASSHSPFPRKKKLIVL